MDTPWTRSNTEPPSGSETPRKRRKLGNPKGPASRGEVEPPGSGRKPSTSLPVLSPLLLPLPPELVQPPVDASHLPHDRLLPRGIELPPGRVLWGRVSRLVGHGGSGFEGHRDTERPAALYRSGRNRSGGFVA